MGTLYARVDGAWVPVVAPAPPPALDEVWVGPSQPTAPETELWVDSDLAPAPMLFAKIGGTWTQVSAPPTNEVAVQADDPGGNVELWYDTDALGYTNEDLRWQSAWGVLQYGIVLKTANQGGFTSTAAPGEEIAGLGTTVTVIAGRRYRISCDVAAWSPAANQQVNFILRLNRASTLQQCNFSLPKENYGIRNYLEYIYTPATSGAVTFTMNVMLTLGTPPFSVNASTDQPLQLVIEDIGPVPGAPLVPSPATPWTAMTLGSGWSNMSGWQPAQYRKLGDVVMLRGLITNSGSNIGIWPAIPAGFGPPYQSIFSAPYAPPSPAPHGAARIDVYPTFMNGVTPVNYLSLNGISWSVSA